MKRLRTVMARIGIAATIICGTASLSAPPAAAHVWWTAGYNMSYSKCQLLGKFDVKHYGRISYSCLRVGNTGEDDEMRIVDRNCAKVFQPIDGNSPVCSSIHEEYALKEFD